MISHRLQKLPPYIFARLNALKDEARAKGADIIDFGMGNPDQATPPHVVQALIKSSFSSKSHRYSASKGIKNLRREMARWYKKRYDITLDMDKEVIACIGTKEGLVHLMYGVLNPGDKVVVPNPTYPIHLYSVILAGGEVVNIPISDPKQDYIEEVEKKIADLSPKPRFVIMSYPHNPTTQLADLDLFQRAVAMAKKHDIKIIHDLAYADICFDGYKAPSFLQAEGAKDVGIEFYSLSKSFNMAGWRIGFAVGNADIIGDLTRTKSYLDYGIFCPVQVGAIAALQGPYSACEKISNTYQKRRDVLVGGLNRIGWEVDTPKATMYVWARLPEAYRHMTAMDFSIKLLQEAEVVVSPGVGFGEFGEGFVRIAMVENEHRIRQAIRNINRMFKKDQASK